MHTTVGSRAMGGAAGLSARGFGGHGHSFSTAPARSAAYPSARSSFACPGYTPSRTPSYSSSYSQPRIVQHVHHYDRTPDYTYPAVEATTALSTAALLSAASGPTINVSLESSGSLSGSGLGGSITSLSGSGIGSRVHHRHSSWLGLNTEARVSLVVFGVFALVTGLALSILGIATGNPLSIGFGVAFLVAGIACTTIGGMAIHR